MADEFKVFTQRFRKLTNQNGGVTNVARLTGISRTTINYWYQGSRLPNAKNLLDICSALNVSADYLLGREEEHNPTSDELVRQITDYTGLSNSSVESLHSIKSNGTESSTTRAINRVMENGSELFAYVEDFIEKYPKPGEMIVIGENHFQASELFTSIMTKRVSEEMEYLNRLNRGLAKPMSKDQLRREYEQNYQAIRDALVSFAKKGLASEQDTSETND